MSNKKQTSVDWLIQEMKDYFPVGLGGIDYMVLCYDVILLNHYDSTYHAGSVSPDGKLIDYNPRPINFKINL